MIVHCSLFIVQLFSCSVVQFTCSVVSCQLSVVPHLSLPWPWTRAEARPSRACSQRKVGRREFTRAHCQLAPTRTRHAHASKRTSECTHHARFIGGRRTKRYQESKTKNQEPRTKNQDTGYRFRCSSWRAPVVRRGGGRPAPGGLEYVLSLGP